jgi:phospholipase/carboxylesterase
MHTKNIITAGKALAPGGKALIMVHGRGASAEDILSLADHLPLADFALLAPEATGHSWYPYSFLAKPKQNEPWLGSALELLHQLVADIRAQGIAEEKIWFLGFSQGACLTLEYTTRHAARYGGVAAFTGGLIGDRIYPENYKGDFGGTPVFISTGDQDPHVPMQRMKATTSLLLGMNAAVTEKIYQGRPHTILADEMVQAGRIVFGGG